MPSYVTHLESAIEPETSLDHRILQTTHADRPLLVRYDLNAVRAAVSRDKIAKRDPTIWRYRELLPVEDDANIFSLGEGMSPIIHARELGKRMGGLTNLFIKDESQLPTGSFKARGLCMAISRAKELGAKRVAIPTAGNAGGALAAYAARAGLDAYIFMPADTPAVNKYETALFGAHVFLVDGLIGQCGAAVREGTEYMNWFDISTLKEPYRIEGKKTMGLELAEQFNWKLPDVILYPTGGGTGLIGMWKAFHELLELDWLDSEKFPRMFACQSTGCAPIPTAFAKGNRFASPFPDPHTIASGLRVPAAVGDFLILDAVRRSKGEARAADEARINEWMHLAARTEGISICPEAAVCIGVLEKLIAEQKINPDSRIVIFNTGAAQKYVETLAIDLPAVPLTLDNKIDWKKMAALSNA